MPGGAGEEEEEGKEEEGEEEEWEEEEGEEMEEGVSAEGVSRRPRASGRAGEQCAHPQALGQRKEVPIIRGLQGGQRFGFCAKFKALK